MRLVIVVTFARQASARYISAFILLRNLTLVEFLYS